MGHGAPCRRLPAHRRGAAQGAPLDLRYDIATPGPAIAWHLRLRDLALIEFELALGAMLLLGVWPAAGWGLALAAYTVFAGASVQKALAGAKSCGCFGPAMIDPKLMAGIDALIVILLLIAGPRVIPLSPRTRRAGMVIAAAFMLWAAGAVAFAAVPRRGLVADRHGNHDFGVVAREQAERCEHVFVMRNTSTRPLRITGATSSCGCTVADLPTDPISPGGIAKVRVRADWSDTTGKTAATVTLHTDSFWTRRVRLTVSAEVGEPD